MMIVPLPLILTARAFIACDRVAGRLMLPYLVRAVFATARDGGAEWAAGDR